MNTEEYILKMDAETANVVSHACELYARILMGQFQFIEHLTVKPIESGDPTFCERIDKCNEGLLQARKAAFPELGGWGHSYGVGHDRGADTAWHTYEALRHTIAWNEHPEGGITVDFDKPMRFSDAPMPECEVAGEKVQRYCPYCGKAVKWDD